MLLQEYKVTATGSKFTGGLKTKKPPVLTGEYLAEIEVLLLQLPLIRNTQFLAAFSATASQNLTAIGCFHALTETVNGFTALTMRLVCTFHALCFFTLNNSRKAGFFIAPEVTIPLVS
jgi:hypothetical protein